MESVSNDLTLQTVDTNSKLTRLITYEMYKRMFFVVHHMELEYSLGYCIVSMTAVHIFMTEV